MVQNGQASASPADRRGFLRIPINSTATVETATGRASAAGAIDVSMTGLRFSTQDPVPPIGSQCTARLVLPGSDGEEIIEVRGAVIRSETGSVAVEFSSIDVDSYWHLRNLVRLNADDPEKAEREFMDHWGIREAGR